MDWNQRAKLRRYVKISFGLHGGLFALFLAAHFLEWGHTEVFQPAVQIDMVALPDLVKAQESQILDTSLPVKDAPPPPPPPEPEKEEMAAPEPETDRKKEEALALKKEEQARKEAQKALERLRSQRKKEEREEQRKRQEMLSKREEDLKRFEETYRSAVRGNQTNQGTSATGAMQETLNAYAGHIREKLRSNWALPVWLQSKGLRAVVRMYIDNRGNIVRYQFMQTSGNDVFDDYVKGAMTRSSPFAPPPEEMARGLRNGGIEVQFPL